MLIIRLQRVGRKNDPSFRLIVTDSRHAAKAQKYLENLGSYDARHGAPQLKADRIKHWIEHGAQVSGTVHNLLVEAKIVAGPKRNVLPKKRPIVKAAEAAPVAAAPEVPEVTEVAPATTEAV